MDSEKARLARQIRINSREVLERGSVWGCLKVVSAPRVEAVKVQNQNKTYYWYVAKCTTCGYEKEYKDWDIKNRGRSAYTKCPLCPRGPKKRKLALNANKEFVPVEKLDFKIVSEKDLFKAMGTLEPLQQKWVTLRMMAYTTSTKKLRTPSVNSFTALTESLELAYTMPPDECRAEIAHLESMGYSLEN